MIPRNRVYFLAKDPHWTFVWWEISEASLDRARAAGFDDSERQLVLRVYDLTDIPPAAADSAPALFDVTITGAANRWYLHLPVSGRTYKVWLGFRSSSGEFHAIAGSNLLPLPPEGPSGCRDESWSTVPFRRSRWKKKAIS